MTALALTEPHMPTSSLHWFQLPGQTDRSNADRSPTWKLLDSSALLSAPLNEKAASGLPSVV